MRVLACLVVAACMQASLPSQARAVFASDYACPDDGTTVTALGRATVQDGTTWRPLLFDVAGCHQRQTYVCETDVGCVPSREARAWLVAPGAEFPPSVIDQSPLSPPPPPRDGMVFQLPLGPANPVKTP